MQSLQEAARLAAILREDPSSAIAAALAGWAHPISREALILMDKFDFDHMVAVGGKKVKSYSRPWKGQGVKVEKPDVTISREQALALLRRAGHTAPDPDP